MKKVFALLACLLLCVTVLAACDKEEPPHEHTFDSTWLYDETQHWHAATCEHAELESDRGDHADADGNDICDVCGYIKDHTHSYDEGWTWNESTHWHKSACGHNVKDGEAKHADENNDAVCDVCTYDYDHTHTYEEAWVSVGESGHWHAPTCGHTVDGADLTPHADGNNDGDCDVCGENGGHEHTYADTFTTTEDEHWRDVTCGHSVAVSDKGVHKDENNDTTCDICGYKPPHFHTFEEGWTSDGRNHWHKASCGHDVRKDETPHDGFESDGVCDTCAHVVFHLYKVTVSVPEYVTVVAPDGTETNCFTVKENTPTSFTLRVPTFAEVLSISGAKQDGKPTLDGEYNVYTVKLDGLTADATVSVMGNKLSAVEMIVSDGKSTLNVEKLWKYTSGEVSFHAPTAGRYMVFSTTNEYVQFNAGAVNEEGSTVFTKVCFIDVTEPTDITLQTRFFAMNSSELGVLDFTYIVAKVDSEITLSSLRADGYTLPTNVDITVHFTVPKAGRYQISSSTLGMVWNDYVCDSIVLTATEDNQQMSFTLRNENTGVAFFNFDCSIVSMEGQPLEEGDTTVTAPYGSYYAVSVTATQAGTYMIQTQNPYINICVWNESSASMNSQGSLYIKKNMKAGDTFTVFLTVDIYDYEGTDDITDTVTVSYLGHVPTLSGGNSTAQVDKLNSFVNEEDASDFIFSLQNGDEISMDGGKTWHYSVQVSIPANGFVSYLVRSADGAGTVTVQVKRIAYEFDLNVGTQTQSMIPDKEYTVYLHGSSDSAYYVSYVLSWNDPAVLVSYNGQLLSSGDTVSNYTDYYALTVVYNGTGEAQVEFTLTDPYAGGSDTPSGEDVLVLGENSVNVTVENFYCAGTTVSFTAPFSGTFVLDSAAGESNAEIWFSPAEGESEMVTLPYTFAAAEGETVAFVICTAAYMTLTEDVIDLTLTRVPTGELLTSEINGTYHVNFVMNGLYVLKFSDGTLTVTDNNSGKASGTYTYYYTAADGVVVTNTDGTACDIVITIDGAKNMTFKCSGLSTAQSLVPA